MISLLELELCVLFSMLIIVPFVQGKPKLSDLEPVSDWKDCTLQYYSFFAL